MLKRLYVLIQLKEGWVPCGLLEFHESGRTSSSVFRYGKKYLERKDRICIDPVQLPLEDRSFETPEGFSVFNGIRDAGPDKWGRYLLEKKFSRALSELEYIAASGDDRVGALVFSDEPTDTPKQYEKNEHLEKHGSKTRLNLDQCMGAVDDAIASEETGRLMQYLEYGPSLGGARPKASVLWKKELYLAKFGTKLDSKNEPLIEYATMSLAKKCGLQVPEIHLEEVDGRSVFLIKRFDRENHARIPFISGLTITGLHESDYSSWSYFAVADALIAFSDHFERDLTELYRRLIFNIAVYNNDDHLRNFGFLATGPRWRLSPLYDVVPSLIRTETYALAMSLGDEGKKASYSNALSMCERFRLEKKQAKRIVDEITEMTSKWEKHFKGLGVSKTEINMLRNSFKVKK
jgi:serine/threonine-protein kinase HipA